ncbi:hypothetical protein [Mycobacterium sp.]|uniref:hypothetical protein n=1 Tax=Mycobacterium sp. TaxID=1785 RepID=UPI003F9B9894
MSRAHPDLGPLGPELRRLAQAILDGIDPAVRSAAALAAGAPVGTGKCQQVWCPVCALAALATGEQHPLLTVVADHSLALLDVIRAMVNDVNDIDRSEKPPPDGSPGGGQTAEPPPGTAEGDGAVKTRYEAIPVTVEE